ncbi:hypothetical protein F5Y10DRAFT_246719 [Nemania abortiva]|nr:hypothetical protein F5Y10DRAFT_246719 [Nemania abortiva]
MAAFELDAPSYGGDRGTLNRNNDDDNDLNDEDDDADLADAWKLLLLKEASDGERRSFSEPGELEGFLDDWSDCLGKTVGKEGNILHRLLQHWEEKDIEKMPHLRDAVTSIVEKYPLLLWQTSAEHKSDSPLWQAISQKEAITVVAFMEGLKRSSKNRSPELESFLKQPVDLDQRSILQLAIEMHLEEEAIQAIASHVTNDALSVRDTNGRTALHAALTYGDCTDDRVCTIKQMILQSSSALGVVDKYGRSLYAHHLWSKQRWLEQKRQLEEKGRREEKATSSNKPAMNPKSASKTAMGQTPPNNDIDPKAKQSIAPGLSDSKDEATNSGLDDPIKGVYDSKRDPGSRTADNVDILSYNPLAPSIQEWSVDGGTQGNRVLRSNQGFRREPIPDLNPIIRRTQSIKLQDQLDREPSSRSQEDERKIAEQNAKRRSGRRMNAEKKAQLAEKKLKRKHDEDRAKAKEQAKRQPHILEANSQKVQLEIKLRCMRTLSPKETARILYGNNSKDRQICFDFPGRPTVRLEAFKMSFQSVKFDEVLQYVAFPSVRFERKVSDEEDASKDGLGRNEMTEIFEWLRDKKKVKRIVKVIVNDFEKPPHSNSAIVKSLKGFHVEELQWLKTDLDPVTILKVGDDIRKLYLRWSGSNTALRAWSDPYGLRKLKHLDTIQLVLTGDEIFESSHDLQENIESFRARMNLPSDKNIDENKLSGGGIPTSNRITVKAPALNTYGRSATRMLLTDKDINHTHIENHKWLKTMDNFREEMIPVWKEAQKRATKDSNEDLFAQPIMVALIDDGVDVLEPSLQGKLIDGKTLSYDLPLGSEPTEQREHAFWESSGGHGTVMANMIFRVCPMAKLYAIRMETHVDEGRTNRINPYNAAEAINAAVDKGVNIISMSWTISPNAESKHSDLQNAIDRAHAKNILMFASSNDGGYFNDKSWPVALKRDAFFRIGAAKADGKPFDWAGPVAQLDYILPGVDVIKYHTKSSQKSDSKYLDKLERMGTETGSSVATALAAGTAAMVLTCARIAAIDSLRSGRGVTENVLNEMQKRDNMAAALERLGVKLGDNKFIEVWRTLDTQHWSSFKDMRPDAKMEMVVAKTIPLLPSQAFG